MNRRGFLRAVAGLAVAAKVGLPDGPPDAVLELDGEPCTPTTVSALSEALRKFWPQEELAADLARSDRSLLGLLKTRDDPEMVRYVEWQEFARS